MALLKSAVCQSNVSAVSDNVSAVSELCQAVSALCQHCMRAVSGAVSMLCQLYVRPMSAAPSALSVALSGTERIIAVSCVSKQRHRCVTLCVRAVSALCERCVNTVCALCQCCVNAVWHLKVKVDGT